MSQRTFLIAARRLAFLSLCYALLSGCSGPDHLQIENKFAFPVLLRRHYTNYQHKVVVEKIGWVSDGETVFFDAAAGHGGFRMKEIEIIQGDKMLGKIEAFTLSKEAGSPSGCNGTCTWHVTLGYKTPPLVKPETKQGLLRP